MSAFSDDLASSYFVSAGAGTGKTRAIVDRILARIRKDAGTADEAGPLSRTVAITFTEKAAGELRHRIRLALEEALAGAAEAPPEKDRYEKALAELETAQVSTIHSFAGGILREFPVEAGVDPAFVPLQEQAAEILAGEVWEEWLRARLAESGDGGIAEALLSGFTTKEIRELATDLLKRSALLSQAALGAAPPREAPPEEVLAGLLAVAVELERILARVGPGLPPGDKLSPSIRRFIDWVESGRRLTKRALFRFLLLDAAPNAQGGVAKVWGETKKEVLSLIGEALVEHLSPFRRAASARLVHAAASEILDPARGYIAAYEARKARAAVLDFDDLLAKTRDLLAGEATAEIVLERLRGRYGEILIDEFQDTDPVQAEIARRLAGLGGPPGLEREKAPPSAAAPPILSVVGDPKQSIYRFRGADLETYQGMEKHFTGRDERRINYRSRPEILAWVNHTFAASFTGTRVPYDPIEADPTVAPAGRACVWAALASGEGGGEGEGKMSADELRRAEGRLIAGILGHLKKMKFSCRTPPGGGAHGEIRPFRWKDAAVLFRKYTGVEIYADEIDREGIPYRLLGGKSFFKTEEVAALSRLMAAVANPADGISVAAALRSMAFGLTDAELYELARAGAFRGRTAAPEAPENARRALEILAELRARAKEIPLSSFAEEAIDRTGLRLLAAAGDDADRRLANLSKAVEILRAWQAAPAFEAGAGGGLAEGAAFLQERVTQEVDEIEGATADEEEDLVRILTVHAAKGLEFPVVFLAGISSRKDGQAPFALAEGKVIEVRLGAKDKINIFEPGADGVGAKKGEGEYAGTAGFISARAAEKGRQAEEEKRLAYVAATRARDLLVIPLPPVEEGKVGYEKKQFIEALSPGLPWPFPAEGGEVAAPAGGAAAAGGAARVRAIREEELSPCAPEKKKSLSPAQAEVMRRKRLGEVEETRARLAAGLVRLERPSELDPDGTRGEGDRQIHPAAGLGRGRAARIGTAVHEVLARVDLATFARVESFARSMALREGLAREDAEEIREIAMNARGLLREAGIETAGGIHREVPFTYLEGDALVRGAIDLLAETREGIVLLDWKTDRAETDSYEPQIAAYARVARAALGQAPVRAYLAFLRPGRLRAVSLPSS